MEKISLEIPLKTEKSTIEGESGAGGYSFGHIFELPAQELVLVIEGIATNGDFSLEDGNDVLLPDSPPLEIDITSMKLKVHWP